jgi:CBS domain-containing protein
MKDDGTSRSVPVEPISSQQDLWKCLTCMREAGLEALPVCDGEILVGLITQEDVLRAMSGALSFAGRFLVRDVMKSTVYCCFEDQDQQRVAQDMAENGVRHALVLSRENDLVGMISIESPEDFDQQTWIC